MEDCVEYVKNHQVNLPSKDLACLKKMKKKPLQKNIVAVKAKKGNSIVLLERGTYESKVHQFLKSSGASEIPESKFNTHIRKVREKIHAAVYILPRPKDRTPLLVPNPRIPRSYGLPKVHKTGMPIRPVVSTIGAPTYHVAMFLSDWFKAPRSFRHAKR